MPAKALDRSMNVRLFLLATALLTGCSSAVLPSAPPSPTIVQSAEFPRVATSKYIYVADRTLNELLVYSARKAKPQPIRTLGARDGIVEVGGVAVDSAGNVYVANGSGADVLEFTRGAKSLVRKYRRLLSHPVNVTVGPNGWLYVVDQQDRYSTGATSSVVEYPPDKTVPYQLLLDPSVSYFPLRGIAVDKNGSVLVSASPGTDRWPLPLNSCALPSESQIFDFILPTLIIPVTLSNNTQAWGLTFTDGVLYAADVCSDNVEIYDRGTWVRIGPLPFSFDRPVYQTLSADRLLAIPCAGTSKNGYVAVVDLQTGKESTVTAGLRGPIGAAAGP